jgi:hypothetical protein
VLTAAEAFMRSVPCEGGREFLPQLVRRGASNAFRTPTVESLPDPI